DLSLFKFITTELTRGYFLEHNEAKYTERRERVYTCLRIPKELEKLMTFGFFLCLDAFLYIFTLLPLRVILALLRLLTLPCCGFGGSRLLQPAQVCDVLKGFIMVLCYFMMSYVDYSMMYHLIRGQSVIKLYIIYNMLEVQPDRTRRRGPGPARQLIRFPLLCRQVADRLFSSFGQDILDALYWTATEPKEKKRAHIGVIPHFLMAVLYVFLHAILIMVQATTLNVAFNSHNKSLLTIMMSNNVSPAGRRHARLAFIVTECVNFVHFLHVCFLQFVEIKGSVFKKFEKNNLFQMSNSDIKERFTNCILLLIVCLRNMEQFSWNPGNKAETHHLWVLFPDVVMVLASEIAVDVVKHAFITKFNDISADVYGEYKASLAFDLVSSRQKNAYTDYSDSVSRRMGFIPLPLALLHDHAEGAQQYRAAGDVLYICQRGRHGGEALRPPALRRLQPRKFQSESCENYSHATERTHNRRRRVAGRHQGRHRGGELGLRSPQERLGHIPDDTGRGRGQVDGHQRRTRRRWTRTEKTQEGSAGDRPLHHLWQQDRLSVV
ncbi:unnamed protein product, partial [Tetraodon nigroviridis]